MKKLTKIALASFAVVAIVSVVGVLATPACAQEKNEGKEKPSTMKAPVAKISPVQAMKIAVGKAGGKASRAMFEYDDGQWIYGVIVVKNHKLMEVEIDATTGKVGDTEAITPSSEAKEFEQELVSLAKS